MPLGEYKPIAVAIGWLVGAQGSPDDCCHQICHGQRRTDMSDIRPLRLFDDAEPNLLTQRWFDAAHSHGAGGIASSQDSGGRNEVAVRRPAEQTAHELVTRTANSE